MNNVKKYLFLALPLLSLPVFGAIFNDSGEDMVGTYLDNLTGAPSHWLILGQVDFYCKENEGELEYSIMIDTHEALGDKARLKFKIDDGEIYRLEMKPFGKYDNVISHVFHKWSYDPKKILNEISNGKQINFKVLGRNSSSIGTIELTEPATLVNEFNKRCSVELDKIVANQNAIAAQKKKEEEKKAQKEATAQTFIVDELKRLGIVDIPDGVKPIRYLRELAKEKRISDANYKRIKTGFYKHRNG